MMLVIQTMKENAQKLESPLTILPIIIIVNNLVNGLLCNCAISKMPRGRQGFEVGMSGKPSEFSTPCDISAHKLAHDCACEVADNWR